jgi:hypothetical protein
MSHVGRSDFQSVKEWLKDLGATEVFTYDDVEDKAKFAPIKKLVSEQVSSPTDIKDIEI